VANLNIQLKLLLNEMNGTIVSTNVGHDTFTKRCKKAQLMKALILVIHMKGYILFNVSANQTTSYISCQCCIFVFACRGFRVLIIVSNRATGGKQLLLGQLGGQ